MKTHPLMFVVYARGGLGWRLLNPVTNDLSTVIYFEFDESFARRMLLPSIKRTSYDGLFHYSPTLSDPVTGYATCGGGPGQSTESHCVKNDRQSDFPGPGPELFFIVRRTGTGRRPVSRPKVADGVRTRGPDWTIGSLPGPFRRRRTLVLPDYTKLTHLHIGHLTIVYQRRRKTAKARRGEQWRKLDSHQYTREARNGQQDIG